MTVQEINALLGAKFQGVRKDGLTNIARLIAMADTTDEGQKAMVDKLSADQVANYVTDWRKDADAEITKANKTLEEGLRAKYKFVDPNDEQKVKNAEPKGVLEPDAISKIVANAVSEATAGMKKELEEMRAKGVTASRREQLAGLFGKNIPEAYKAAVFQGFDHRTFASDAEYDAYLSETKQSVAAFEKELADSGLSAHNAPVMGKTNREGVSAGVEAYLKEKTAGGSNLGGKSL